jgi:AcrR family transcriptional regulator
MSSIRQEEIRRRNDPADRSVLRKSERTRQAILDAALGFLWSNPFRDLTIAELMAQTDTSRPAFYQYFADLHDLMETLLDTLKQEILDVAEPWLTAEEDPISELAEALSGLTKVSYRRGPIIRAVVEAAPMDERLERAWNDFLQVFDDAVTARIQQDQAAGLVEPFEARPVAVALNRMDVGVLIHHFGRRPRSKPDRVYPSIARIWISTIYGQDALARVGDS